MSRATLIRGSPLYFRPQRTPVIELRAISSRRFVLTNRNDALNKAAFRLGIGRSDQDEAARRSPTMAQHCAD